MLQRLQGKKQNSRSLIGCTLLPLLLLAGGWAAAGSAPGESKWYRPVTDGDGIRYPLVLTPAVWHVFGQVRTVYGTDGLYHVSYVLDLPNHSGSPFTISAFDVVDPDRDNILTGHSQVLAVDNADVTGQVLPYLFPITLDAKNYTHTLTGGQSGAVYFDVTYPDLPSIPQYISHRLTVNETAANGTVTPYTAIDAPIHVDQNQPVVLSPPLHGPRWLDGNGCCKQIGPHRWVLSPLNGDLKPAEMFSMDLVQLDSKGRGYVGDVTQLSSFPFYGVPVYAAAGGTVIEVVRDVPNSIPGSNPPGLPLDSIAGNHIIVDIGNGRYIMYAHLIPESPTVKVGDTVYTGQVLGKLGNSGNSDSPHLHFQVMDRPSPLDAHGLPFVFDQFKRTAVFNGTIAQASDDFLAGKSLNLTSTGVRKFENTMPLSLDLIDFGH